MQTPIGLIENGSGNNAQSKQSTSPINGNQGTLTVPQDKIMLKNIEKMCN